MSRLVDSLVALRILKILATPFDKTDAYRLGIIDANGKILKKSNELRTSEEQNAYTILHRMAWKIRRLFAKVPEGSRRIATLAAALYFIREAEEHAFVESDLDTLEEELLMIAEDEELMIEAEELLENARTIKGFSEFIEEEIAANSTASVEGLRTEPVVRKKDQVKLIKRQGKVK